MNEAPLKVVCIGGWGHTNLVLDEMVGLPETEICGIAPAYSGEDLADLCAHVVFSPRIPPVFNHFACMLEKIHPDVAIVSSRLDCIAPAATAAANAGCHLLCEKPLGISHSQCDLLQEAVSRNGVRLMAMHSMRNFPAFVAAREAFQSGLIGSPVIINARKSYRWGERPDWFAQRETYGGIIPWVGIHAWDAIHFVTGCRPVRICAMHGNQAHQDYAECEDHATLIVELSNGAHASISLDMVRPDAAEHPADNWIRIMGTRGMIEANSSKGICEVAHEGLTQRPLPLPEPDTMFRTFLLSILGQGEAPLSTEDSFALTRVCLAARDSADEGRVIAL